MRQQGDLLEGDLTRLAGKILPAGNLGNMPGTIVMKRGAGGHVWDTEGQEYIDFLLGSGPMILGHAHPEVCAAVMDQVPNGSTFFVNNEHAIHLAAEIVDAIPCAEQVRFLSSGTEADAYAMRLARAFRRKSKILKFEGGYHGMSDWGLMSIWPKTSSNTGRGVPDTAGVPPGLKDDVLVVPFNDLATARDIIHRHKDELAAVIVEPMQRLLVPQPGFLQGLRDITTECGVVLIFDEIVTGFRLCYGGAQTYYGVTPDICTLGKIIGGGFPLSSVCGRADIMAHFDEKRVAASDFMPQVGTLNGNPVAAAAGLATLNVLKRPGTYEQLFTTGRALWAGIETVLSDAGLPAVMLGEPSMFDVVFSSTSQISDYRGLAAADKQTKSRLNEKLLKLGILKSEQKIYLSIMHDIGDVTETISAFSAAAHSLPPHGN